MATNYDYNLNIPFATNKPSVDQPDMQINTNSIASIIGTDHLTFGTATGSQIDGYHNIIHFNTQLNDPNAIPGTGQLYTRTISGDQELFYESGNGIKSQLTSPSGTSPGFIGYTFLPGGIIMQWGFINGTHSGSNHTFNAGDTGSVTFPIPFPNNIFTVQTTLNFNTHTAGSPASSSAEVVALDYFNTNNTGFRWQISGSGSSYTVFYWTAIGN
jgi:hypothetical protein